MARYDDYPPSSSLESEPVRWDADRFSRERESRRRGPALAERPRPVEDDRFESRIRQGDRYGPPARRPESYYEDDDLVRPPAPSVARDRHRRVADPPPPPRPGLLRRQSSLDTFDRIPSRKLDEYYSREYAPRAAPIQMPPTRRSPPRRERDYEEIRIAEPDFYGDEEYRDFFERERWPRPRSRSSSGSRLGARLVEEVDLERPYPRKGKTRLPRRLVHPRAIIELGYPFFEEGNMVILLMALSKEQIDEVISVSRQIRRRPEARIRRTSPSPIRSSPSPIRERIVEHVGVDSPRSSHDTLLVAPSPRHRSPSRSRSRHYRKPSDPDMVRTISRPRSISHRSRSRRTSSPMRTGPLSIVPRRRRSSDVQLTRDPESTSGSDEEDVLEVKRERKAPNPLILRAMMATLT